MFIPLKSLDNQFGIDENAQIINFKTNHILSPYIGIDLYQHVTIKKHGRIYRKRVHRLMAEAFFKNSRVIDHIDGNKANNVLTNLRPITHSENIKKAYEQENSKKHLVGRNCPIIVENKDTQKKQGFSSLRAAEKAIGVDRHRIKTFLEGTCQNYTIYNFYYGK